jgi:hypothetical protein
MSIPCQVDPHTGIDAANDPALLVVCCVGAGHRGVISPRHWRVPVPLRRHRQVHQVAGSNPSGQHQQAIRSKIHQVHHIQIWGPKQGHHPTMGPNLLVVPSKGTAQILASRFAMHLLLTQRAMGRWSEPMQKYSRVLRLAPTMA